MRTFYVATALVRFGLVRFGFRVKVVNNFTSRATLTPGLAYRPIEPPPVFDVHAIHIESRPPSAIASPFLRDRSAEIAGA